MLWLANGAGPSLSQIEHVSTRLVAHIRIINMIENAWVKKIHFTQYGENKIKESGGRSGRKKAGQRAQSTRYVLRAAQAGGLSPLVETNIRL